MSEDTAVVFWSPELEAKVQSVLDLIPDLFEPPDSLEAFGNLFAAVRTGVLRELSRPAAFYAMTLTTVTGRVVVRDWLESTVAGVQASLRDHLDAIACVRNTPSVDGRQSRPIVTMRELLDSLAAPEREKKVPAALAADFVTAALSGRPYPTTILQRALLRERAEVTAGYWESYIRRNARAALIKAVLTRHRINPFRLEVSMDETRVEPGYLLGRLMAVLEDTQRLASGGVKDKFYGAASATPAAVFPTMMDMFHKHARKARDIRPGATVNREKLADTIIAGLKSIPVHLDLNEQGLFVLGYHHQRHELRKKSSPSQAIQILEGVNA